MNQYIRALRRAIRRERSHYIRQKERVERWYREHPDNLRVITGVRMGEVVRDPVETIDISRRYGACWWEYSELGSVLDERSYHLRYNDQARTATQLRSEAKEAFAWLLLADDVVQEPAGRALHPTKITRYGRVIHRHEMEAETIYRRVVRSEAHSVAY